MQIAAILSFLLIQSFHLSSTSASHCGKLNINCPFLLRGSSPSQCKDGFLEVVCEGNNTFWYLEGNKYLITEISYPQKKIRLVDPSLLSGPCPIPNQMLPYESIYFRSSSLTVSWIDSDKSYYYPYEFYYFLNCSRQLNGSQYIPVPCVSSIGGSYTYVVKGSRYVGASLSDIPNSCRNFAGTITDEDLTTGSDVFVILQRGFLVGWGFHDPHPAAVKKCMRELRE